VDADGLALVHGLRHTRATLSRWRGERWAIVGHWLALSGALAVGLLVAVYVVARAAEPDPTPLAIAGLNQPAGPRDVLHLLARNSLVLALHALACVAGFLAGSALPAGAPARSPWSRLVHERAGSAAMLFVAAATGFSLFTQTLALGMGASTLAAQLAIPPGTLLLALLPHAAPELVALFLPLAAWLLAGRRRAWHELLAATGLTVAIAAPALVLSALIEVYVTPLLLLTLRGQG